MLTYTKADGEYVEHDWTQTELKDWFKSNTDKEGNVQNEIILFGNAEIKSVNGSHPWVMSDFTLDRDGERIDPGGWDLKAFKKNPIVQWAHERSIPAIGKVNNPRVHQKKDDKTGELTGDIEFDQNDEFAVKIEKKVDGGFLSAGSVGFRSIVVELNDDPKEEAWLIHRKQELYEFSICNVPSNPAAMRRDIDLLQDANAKQLTEKELTVFKEEWSKSLCNAHERIEVLENDRNIYRDLFKDRDEISSKIIHATSGEFKEFFEEPEVITLKEIIDG